MTAKPKYIWAKYYSCSPADAYNWYSFTTANRFQKTLFKSKSPSGCLPLVRLIIQCKRSAYISNQTWKLVTSMKVLVCMKKKPLIIIRGGRNHLWRRRVNRSISRLAKLREGWRTSLGEGQKPRGPTERGSRNQGAGWQGKQPQSHRPCRMCLHLSLLAYSPAQDPKPQKTMSDCPNLMATSGEEEKRRFGPFPLWFSSEGRHTVKLHQKATGD